MSLYELTRALITGEPVLQEWLDCRQALLDDLAKQPAWVFSTPVLASLAAGGLETDGLWVAAGYCALDLASHLLDGVEDGDAQNALAGSPQGTVNLCTGLIFIAQHFLANIQSPGGALRAMRILPAAGFRSAHGQQLGFRLTDSPPLESLLEDYWQMVILKSGSQLYMAAACGAAAATENEKTIAAFGEFGAALGVILQILDDCRDVLDVRRRRFELSLPVLLYSLALGQGKVVYPEAETREALHQVFQESGVIAMISAVALEWKQRALNSLGSLEPSEPLDELKMVLDDILQTPLAT